ncbi:hypothetical protein ACFLYR_02785 [Chloroflexota bacterium]
MRCGCISLGDTCCEDCHHAVEYLERYLLIAETEGVNLRLCLDCALKRGYARYKQEKGEKEITFFPE